MVHAAGIDPTHSSRARALVSGQLPCTFKQTLAALPALIGMAVHLNVLYVRKVCLVKIEIQRVRIMTQLSTDEFCGLLSVIIIIRIDEFIKAHVRLESGLYTIEDFECEITTVGDETGFVQVSTAAIAGGMIVPITSCVFFQNKPITQVDFESIGLLFEHGLQWRF